MSRSVWIVLILLALWIFLALYLWNVNPFLKGNNDDAPCVISWELAEGGKSIVKSDATINFKMSTAQVSNMGKEISSAISSIGKYLKDNSGKKVTIIGYHDITETYESSLYDLSLARANAVKKMLVNQGVSESQLHVLPKQYKDNDDSRCLNNNVLNRGASFVMGMQTK